MAAEPSISVNDSIAAWYKAVHAGYHCLNSVVVYVELTLLDMVPQIYKIERSVRKGPYQAITHFS